ncbi:hypothetical protein GCM10027295_02610 [Pseudaeromonas pectinilytica]
MTLIEHLTLVEETRSEINRKHNLVDVMFLVISAIMSGAEGWNDIETYGDSKIDWLLFKTINYWLAEAGVMMSQCTLVVAWLTRQQFPCGIS